MATDSKRLDGRVYPEDIPGFKDEIGMDLTTTEMTNESTAPDSTLAKVLTYIIFFMLGVGTVLPWNVFITGDEFFRLEFKNSKYASNFQNYFSIISMSVQLFLLVPAILSQRKHQIYWRLVVNLSVAALVFLAVTIFPFFEPSSLSPDIKFGLVLIPLFATGTLGVFGFTDVFTMAAMFPAIYIQGLVSGQAIGGLVVSLIQVLITAADLSSPDKASQTPEESVIATLNRAKAYFGTSLLISLVNLGLLLALPLLPTYRKYTSVHMKKPESEVKVTLKDHFSQLIGAFKSVRLASLSVVFNFIVTLALFPSITALVRATNPAASMLYKGIFVGLHFVMFNVGDVIGRLLLGFQFLRPRSSKLLFGLSLIRVIFFLLFLTSKLDLGNPALSQAFPVWINHDAGFFIIMLIFATTNGYINSGAMMLAPSLAPTPSLIPSIGNVMSFSTTVGLALGSYFSFVIRAAVCQCNSFLS